MKVTNFRITTNSRTEQKCLDNFFGNIISVGHSQVWRLLKSILGGACTLSVARLDFSTTVFINVSLQYHLIDNATLLMVEQSGGVCDSNGAKATGG